MGRLVTFVVRASGPTERFPAGSAEEMLPASYDPHEFRLMADLNEAAQSAEDDKRRDRAMASVEAIHGFKALLGARVLTDEELVAMGEEGAEQPRTRKMKKQADALFDAGDGGQKADNAARAREITRRMEEGE